MQDHFISLLINYNLLFTVSVNGASFPFNNSKDSAITKFVLFVNKKLINSEISIQGTILVFKLCW